MSTGDSSTSAGGAIAGVSIAVGVFLLVLAFMCSLCHGYRTSRENSAGPPEPAAAGYWDDDDEQEARRRGARREHGRLRRSAASPTAGLPSFTYKPSSSVTTKHNATGGGGGEETCSVCLGAFQAGETVRLLPVCLHLYHVECIDPWLDVHSTCPICRSGIDSPMDDGLLPPV
ncbi:hypothetical protein QOZ80_6BG0495310 [Eleusine coracana subsp. coracana]|nr:hypothetical protein QOZ80_6BG0495310 [Eleusine coracana subsp. coracana]